MKYFTHTALTTLATLALFFASTVTVYAQTLDVTFEQDPLFSGNTTINPGDVVTRFFSVENTGSDTRTVYVRTLNDTQTANLAEALLVTITEDGSSLVVYDGSLYDLFIRDNKSDSAPLGSIDAGDTKTYDIAVTFDPQSGNNYQNGTAEFDFCVGFDGGNENCITGTGTTDDNPDGDDDTGGSSGSSNTGGGSSDPQPGIVAGTSTSMSTPSFVDAVTQSVSNFLQGRVLGESTSTEETSTTSPEATATGVPDRSSSPIGIVLGAEFCTLWWLLLLALISFSWSLIEDKLRKGSTGSDELFIRNAIFAGVYAVLAFLFFVFNVLDTFWWLFAGAWIIATVIDYRAHHNLPVYWEPAKRNLFFGGAGVLFILTAFVFGFPCVWWPFFLLTVGSALLYLFDTND